MDIEVNNTPPLSPFRPRRWISICVLLLAGCALSYWAAFYIQNGGYYCSTLDQVLHTTPCYRQWSLSDRETIRHLTFSPDSRSLAVTTNDGVFLLDAATGTTTTLPFVLGGNGHRSSFSPDGTLLATTGKTGVQVVELASQHVRYTIPGVDSAGGGVIFSPDGRLLARTEVQRELDGQPGLVRIYHVQDGSLVQIVAEQFELDQFALRFTPDNQHLIMWVGSYSSSPDNREVWVWDLQSQSIASKAPGSSIISPDATTLLGYKNGEAMVMSLAPTNDRYEEQHQIQLQPGCGGGTFFPSNDRLITITNTDDDLFFPSDSPTLCVWRLSDGQVLWQSQAQGYCVAVAPNGELAAICKNDVQIWRIPSEWYQ